MKALMYLLVVVFGLVGILSLLRFADVLMLGGRLFPDQLLYAVVGIGIALVCLKEARSR